MSGFQCYKAECIDKIFETFSSLLSHIRAVHSHEPNFSITCGLKGCKTPHRKYHVWSSYTSHLTRCHGEEYAAKEKNTECQNLNGNSEFEDDPICGSTTHSDDGEECDQPDAGSSETRESIMRNLANFIVKTQETNKLSKKATFEVLDETLHLVERNVDNFKRKIVECTEDVRGLKELLSEESEFLQAYQHIGNKRKLRDYPVEEMDMVVSMKNVTLISTFSLT